MKQKLQRLPAAFAILGILLVAFLPRAGAITVKPPSFTALVEKSDTVVRGTVVDKETKWVVNDAGYRVIKTYVTLRIEEQFKGDTASGQIVLSFLGGTVGGETMEIAGMPTFRKGQNGWFFVAGNGKVFCPLVYAQHGAYLAVNDPASGQERVVRLNGAPLADVADIAKFEDHSSPAIEVPATSAQSLSHALSATTFSAAIKAEKLAIEARQNEIQ